ncbi:hypothetical protein H6S82_13135 [Planktothrix sp. FACHB-1355]|uniref:Uncharacterized protein n=1 Tax=Aerosakkonema funiforme FACHB-1375 TaxID=2949571 RepID=A0A926VIY0_9CYAN|nr:MULTISPECIES: hypothetical protein [Oscillatoriales]MBD2184699.1 hypothetical protein [Aerosakkonema funiforme FACHB-1375]MBD3559798.1 hypothetical protein [Planktothrix sp. FACHB-1355]
MFSTHSSQNAKHLFKPPIELVALLLYVAASGYTVGRFFIDANNYTIGYEAYRNADCTAAVAHFDKVIDGWRFADLRNYASLAKQKKSQCLNLISAKETLSGDPINVIEVKQ